MFLRIPFGPSQEDTIYANQLQIIWAMRKQKLPLIFFFQSGILSQKGTFQWFILRDVYDVTCSDYNHFQAEFILLRTSTPDDINPFWYFLICSIQSGGAHVAGNELKVSNTWKTLTKRLCNALDIACLAQSREYSRCSIHICWEDEQQTLP